MSKISIPISLTAFLILLRILRFIEKIFASTSNFLAFIPIGFLTQCSKSTIKFSGITFNISLFGKSTQFLAISRALSISSSDISHPDTAITHLFLITSYEDELNEINAHATSSPDIFSASSRDLSRLFLNSSISRIFHFLIAFESEIPTPNIWKSSCDSLSKYPIIVLIFELQISMVVITLETHIILNLN